jgi:putative phage-type endonuclease
MVTIGSAIEILPPGADRTDRDAWLAARREGITASEIAAILGLSRWNSPLSLYFQKRGELDEDESNYRMALGIALEPHIASLFTELTGMELEQSVGLVANSERPWQRCTPDRMVDGLSIPCELKTAVAEDGWGSSGTSMVPISYRAQLLWQLDCLGADHGYLCVVFLRSGEPRWYEIPWDAEDIGVMREAGQEFLQRVRDGDPPAADAAKATRDALKTRFPAGKDAPVACCGANLVRSYRAALRADRRAADRKSLAENRLREIMGQSTRLVGPDGETIATRRVYTRAGYEVKEAIIDALYPARGMRET